MKGKNFILHIVPSLILDPKHEFLGVIKDIRGRTEYFQERKLNYQEIIVQNKSDDWLLEKLKDTNLGECRAVILEYSLYPKSLHYLRNKYSELRLITRAHNAGFFQWLHYSQARLFNLKDILFYRDFINSFKRFKMDYLSLRYSDYLLSISTWETKNYWNYLTSNKKKILYTPYFLPTNYINEVKIPLIKKYNCLCLTSTTKSTAPFLLQGIYKFIDLVGKLGSKLPEWNFYITGDIMKENYKIPTRIKFAGFVKNPVKLVSQSRAVVLFSDFGFGVKTKLIDAAVYKNYLLVTKKIFQRMPGGLDKYCFIVDLSSVESFRKALNSCLQNLPDKNINDKYRKINFQSLDKILKLCL